MKLTQTVVEKHFTLTHRGKTYYVDFINSSAPIMLGNRNTWQVLDEDLEELNIYVFKNTTKKELKQIKKNARLYDSLINFCIKHFEDCSNLEQV